MYKEKTDIYIRAISPIHAGTGQSLTSVDMPIQREQHSNIPKIEGSSLKGSIKHTIYHKLNIKETETEKEKEFYSILGSQNGEDSASGVSITDAKLLFFPMRSATDIYKLITCPYILKRWKENTNQDINLDENILNLKDGECIVGTNKRLLNEKLLMLEEYIFDVKEGSLDIFVEIPDIETFKNKIVILSDSDFINMVSMYTEIITRNKIDVEKGTAEGTALFTEEYLPAETVLYFSIMESAFYERKYDVNPLDFVIENLGKVFQVGGNETIGKGFVKILNITQKK